MFVHEKEENEQIRSGRIVIKEIKFCEIKSIISGVFVPEYLSVSPVLEFRQTRAQDFF